MKQIFRIALAPVFALALAVPAVADAIPLGQISNYLNGLTTVQSKFTQVNADGSISTGTVYIKRPGRARFEYDNDNTLVIAGGSQVGIFDGKSNLSRPEQYPLSKTPLKLILDRNVNLAQSGMVTNHREDGAKTIVTAQDPAHPEYGNIQMVFTAQPTELRQWVVTDDTGAKTTVILGDLQKGGTMGASLFSIKTEQIKRGG
ncbi:cell envelope biogenesis protein LolA [Thioclava sp. SK-1]|uniref:LolA family protein n=1 Tax=Thioclava sp. SK-1 TaxID=1889770 RepID=UPI000824CD7C|nr:outer membrane lipoprotein carrier protein LolA [Thioclava sp. SK-1]OCX59841.1 cell envelope biogenesis protein LolA [Thioclava sp. SK-1]